MNLDDLFKSRDYNFPYIWMFKDELDRQIIALKYYINENEKLIQAFNADFKKKVDSDPELKSDDEYYQASYYNNYYQPQEDFIAEFQNLHRMSTFVSIFSYLESKLKSICEILEKETSPTKSLQKVKVKKGGDLQRFLNFLTVVLTIDDTKWIGEYNQFALFKELRNAVVHNGGVIEQTDIQLVTNTSGLTLNHNQTMFSITDADFLRSLLETMEKLFTNLFEAIDDYIGVLQKNKPI